MTTFEIDFEPIGKRVVANREMSLLTAAQEAGIAITAVCGGVGICQDCKIRCLSGQFSDIQNKERDTFSAQELAEGWRLACQTYPQSNGKIEIPPESMSTAQRLQIEGLIRDVAVAPEIKASDFTLSPPNLTDLRADWERFVEDSGLKLDEGQGIALPVLRQFSEKMRQQNWKGRVIFREGVGIIGFLPVESAYFGVAVDIGTTKMAAFLVNLESGHTEAKIGAMNPQIAYGEDVVSRIAYANQGDTQHKTLQIKLVETLNRMISDLVGQVGITTDQVVDFVVVGNTAIHHLFARLPVRQLGQAPYVPAVRRALRFSAHEVGLVSAPGARVYLPPNIAGYVGADHVAMLLAADLDHDQSTSLAMDIGTNTEITLSKEGHLMSCSCASGPAFEGAHIHAGMRAVPGAIERAQFYDGDWHISTVADQPPIGICGSGILDVVAELLDSGQIDSTGRFTDAALRLVDHPKGGVIILVPAALSGNGNDILVTRSDIREIQLAKAAIRAGVEALLRESGIEAEEISRFIIAGAFGTYLHLDSAIKIGMFPNLARERFSQIGNAAGAGAQQMLISSQSRVEAEAVLSKMDYLELTTNPEFSDSYIDAMGF